MGHLAQEIFACGIPLLVEGLVKPGDNRLFNFRSAEPFRGLGQQGQVEVGRVAPALLKVNVPLQFPVLSALTIIALLGYFQLTANLAHLHPLRQKKLPLLIFGSSD